MAARKHNADWTKQDIKRLRRMARSNKSAREAGEVLGRSRGAVAFKAMVLGISFRSIRQPKGVQKRLARRRKSR